MCPSPRAPPSTWDKSKVAPRSLLPFPNEAKLKVDIRSESEDEHRQARVRRSARCIAAGVRDEMESRANRTQRQLEWKVELSEAAPVGNCPRTRRYIASLASRR